jgi:FkbM family methyltransferase
VKFAHGWWWPDHEKHLLDWMASKENRHTAYGRPLYQGRKQMLVLERCKQRRVAIDVGAHIGLWAYNLAHEFDDVFCVEPIAVHRECLKENLVKLTNWTLSACALGAEQGTVLMESAPGSSGDSKIVPGAEGVTPMMRLDDLAGDDVDLIKIDCEGFEENVIRGGEVTIRAWKPVIIVEQKRAMSERYGLQDLGAVALLQSWGYKMALEYGGDYIMAPG